MNKREYKLKMRTLLLEEQRLKNRIYVYEANLLFKEYMKKE
jgi:hypothetical protein